MVVGVLITLPFVLAVAKDYVHISTLYILGAFFGMPLAIGGLSKLCSTSHGGNSVDLDVARIRFSSETEMFRKK